MADLNDLLKPDSTSNYSTEVLQTLKGHITRLWIGDYTGMSNLVANMRRWVSLGGGDVKLLQRAAGGSESTLFDSSLKANATGTNATGTWPVSVSGSSSVANSAANLQTLSYTVQESSGKIIIKYGSTTIASIDPTNGYTFPDGTSQASAGAVVSGTGTVYENNQTITANYTMTTGKNGQSAGPITIATSVTVTIPDGSTWVIN